MWTFRSILAIGLFLFGSTFLWMTASMAGKAAPPKGTVWTLANVLAFTAVIGFSVTAWAVFKQSPGGPQPRWFPGLPDWQRWCPSWWGKANWTSGWAIPGCRSTCGCMPLAVRGPSRPR
jgi:hypothetical protein